MKILKSIWKQVIAWSVFIDLFWVFFSLLEVPIMGTLILFLLSSWILGVITIALLNILGFVGTWVTEVTEDLNFFKEKTKDKQKISTQILFFLTGAVLIGIGYYLGLINL